MNSTIELSDRTYELLQLQKQKHGLSSDNAIIYLLLREHLGLTGDPAAPHP